MAPDAQLARLRDPAARERIAHEMEHVGSDGCHGCVIEWNTIEIGGVRNPALNDAVGRTIAALATERWRAAR